VVVPAELTSQAIQRALRQRLLRHVFLRGTGAPLLFLWVMSAGGLWAVLGQAGWALLVTGVCLLSGGLIVREYWRSAPLRAQLIRALFAERFPLDDLGTDTALRASLARGLTYGTEIVVKILALAPQHAQDPELLHVLTDTDGLVALQRETARHLSELQRVLTLIEGRQDVSPTRPGPTRATACLQQENLRALHETLQQARAAIDEITQQLETLLLQVTQMDRRAGDMVRTAQVAQAATETLGHLQRSVNARRQAAEELLATLYPPRADEKR